MEETTTKKRDLKEFWRAVKFTLISISAGIVQTLSYTLCYEVIKLNHWIASAIGLVLSVIWNFTINRKVTFKSVSNVNKAMLLVAAFYVVFGPLAIWLNYLAEGMANGYLLLAATMIVNLVLEYIYMRLVVYRNSCDTASDKKSKAEVQETVAEVDANATVEIPESQIEEQHAEKPAKNANAVEEVEEDGTENPEQPDKEKEEK